MRNRYLETYNSRVHKTFSNLDKNYFRDFINNSNDPNFIAINKINKLNSDIRNKFHNKKILKKSIFLNACPNTNSNLKPRLKIETHTFNNKPFIRQFEEFFEQTTNNQIKEYFNGEKIEKMNDLVNRIKLFNNIDFIQKIKRKKSKNKKAYNNYKPRNLSSRPYNYVGCSYSTKNCGSNKKEDNFYDIYLSPANAKNIGNIRVKNKLNYCKTLNNLNFDLNDYIKLSNIKGGLEYNFEKNGNRKYNYYRNKSQRLKTFGDNKKFSKDSFSSRINKKNIDNFIYQCKTQKNLNLNLNYI